MSELDENMRTFPWIMVLVLAVFASVGLLSCSPAPAAVDVTAAGALSIPSLDGEVRLRAYCPEVELLLLWEREGGGAVEIVVENIDPSAGVEVIPGAEQQPAACTTSAASPASLNLSVEGSGRQRIRLTPSAEKAFRAPFYVVLGDR